MLGNQPMQIQEKNIYLIKSIEKQMLIGIPKEKNKLKFCSITQNCKKGYHWRIQSQDQNEQIYKFRFGEFVQMQNLQRYHPIIETSLMLQCLNYNIDSQVFQNCSQNLVLTNPCLFKNVKTNLYMNIENDEISFNDQPYYFQIIPIKMPQDNQEIQRPILNQFKNKNFSCFIRNYITGFSLSFSTQLQNEIYLSSKPQENQQYDKWQFINELSNLYQLYNLDKQRIVQDLSNDQLQVRQKIFLIDNQPKHSWRILCPEDNKEMTYGVPFLIQHNINGYYLSIEFLYNKENENDEFLVVLKKNIESTSLWVIFDMKQ